MNTNDFYELKKSYDTSQMPEKEVIKMKEKMNQAKAEKKNKHNKTIITRIWVGAAAAIAAFVILQILHRVSPMRWNRSHCLEI